MYAFISTKSGLAFLISSAYFSGLVIFLPLTHVVLIHVRELKLASVSISSSSSFKASWDSGYGATSSSMSLIMDLSPTISINLNKTWFNSSLSIIGFSPVKDSFRRFLSPLSITTITSLWVAVSMLKCLNKPRMIPKWFILTSAPGIPSFSMDSEHIAITSASPCGDLAPINSQPNCQNCLNLPFCGLSYLKQLP